MEEGKRHDGNRFKHAARHSARVRLLRWLVPTIAVVLFLGAATVMTLSRVVLPGVDMDLAASVISDGQLVIADPTMDGVTNDNRAYRVTARSATQALGSEELSLNTLRADIELDAQRTARFRAASAVFDPGANTLVVERDGEVETSDGTRAFFSRAHVDLEDGTFVTEQPVRVRQPGTEIEAGGLTIEDNGKRFVFEGDVHVVFSRPPDQIARERTESPQSPE